MTGDQVWGAEGQKQVLRGHVNVWADIQCMGEGKVDDVLTVSSAKLDRALSVPPGSDASPIPFPLLQSGVLFFPAARTLVLNMTAPVMAANGVMRWAVNNVAMPTDPPCQPLMATLRSTPDWLQVRTSRRNVWMCE